jgi:pyruvate dehydrogenase E1 component alpha subunit
MDPRVAIAELFGRETGCSKGKGGSMHLFQADVGNHGGHGIVGGHIPLGLGMAFAQAYKKNGGVTYCLFGDGAINQGTFNEALNMASLLKVPAIFIVENNGVAMGTQVERHSAEKDLAKRGCGFNMPHYHVDGNDVDIVMEEMKKAADRARRGEGPSYISADTFRFRGHSMSDPLNYRTKEEAEKAKQRDPITLYEKRLRDKGLLSDDQQTALEEGVAEQINRAFEMAEADPNPPLDSRFDDALSETYPYQPK